MIALYRSKEARHAGRRRRVDRRRAKPGRSDRAIHRPLRPQSAPSRGVQGVRLQERDPADGDRPHRRAAQARDVQLAMQAFHFELGELPPEAEALRSEVREFLRRQLGDAPPVQRAHSWGGFDREFSRKMGAKGWIAMTWPKRYGGHEKSALERYVVLEEMLAAGAPVSAHWIADRQSGPLLLRFGTEAQRQKFLPAIARGELSFAIGMSEPDSGSDLASLRTRAERVAGGYR